MLVIPDRVTRPRGNPFGEKPLVVMCPDCRCPVELVFMFELDSDAHHRLRAGPIADSSVQSTAEKEGEGD